MKKLIFLDIDGVLNSQQWFIEKCPTSLRDHIDPKKVKLLAEIIKDTDAEIVISSTWRVEHYSLILEILKSMNFDTSKIIGKTPLSNTGHRGTEIQAWISEFVKEEFTFVIIDDSSDMLETQLSNFVRTSFYDDGGLQEVHVLNAIKILNTW